MATFPQTISLLIKASAQGAVTELNRLEKASAGTEKSVAGLGKTMKAGLAAAGAAALSAGLVAGVKNLVTGYAQAAKAAGDLAAATGGSVEEVSRMQAALVDAGVSAEQSAQLLTKFTTAAGTDKGAKALEDLNVALVKGQGGAVDYAATMVRAVDAVGEIGDAAERNQKLVTLFGKAGAQAFQDLMASGLSLAEAMDAVAGGRVFTDKDIRNAAEYDDAMDSLAASTKQLGNTLGRTLVPLLAVGATAFADLIDIASKVPTEIYLVVGAMYALNAAMKSTLLAGAASAIGSALASGATTAATAWVLAGGTIRGVLAGIQVAFLASPVGVVLAGVAAALAVMVVANRQFTDEVNESAAAMRELEKQGLSTADALKRVAEEAENTDTVLAGMAAAQEGGSWWEKLIPPTGAVGLLRLFLDSVTGGGDSLKAYQEKTAAAVDAQKNLAEEQGAYAESTRNAKEAQDALNELIASGVTSGQQFADAVAAAGDALAAQDANARAAAAALDQYRASTDQAYESTLKLLDLTHSERSAARAAEGAADAAADARANLDKALADAKAAKTVVEHIAAIQGRARRREETEGIIKGSTDVREIEGIKGRRARDRVKVLEKAGFITPAEQRQIRAAARAYEQALDDISQAWIDLAQARIEHKEALGIQLSEVEKLAIVRDTLKEGLKIPGLSPQAKEDIAADLKVVEEKIKALGGMPVVIDGIHFKEGTTEKAVRALKGRIAMEVATGNYGLATQLQQELDGLKWTAPPVPVSLVGPDGQPLGATSITVGLNPDSVTGTQAGLANIGVDPATGNPYTATLVATLDPGTFATDLAELSKDRAMTITVNWVPGTGGDLPGVDVTKAKQSIPLPGARGNRINFKAPAGGMVFAPQIVNNYPKPERASDSVAASLRAAKFMVGA